MQARSSLAVSFCTSMTRPDAALALAAIHGLETRRLSRAGSVCVVGAGLEAAMFCDIVRRFFTVGPVPTANDVLPVGLAVSTPMPADPPMVRPAIERKNEKGTAAYARSIRTLTDTSQAEAVLRNGVTLQRETAFVLSAPATVLARCLDLLGVKELFAQRVKRLVIVDTGEPHQDPAALRKVLTGWPTPVILCGREVGAALMFPGAALETSFAWTSAHPVVDAYRAFKAMPYDTPCFDLAAVHYAGQPDAGVFQASEPGTLSVSDSGQLTFAAGGGTAVSLRLDPARRGEVLQALVDISSTKPVAPTRGGPPTA